MPLDAQHRQHPRRDRDRLRPRSCRVRGRSRPPARAVRRAVLGRWRDRARRDGRGPPPTRPSSHASPSAAMPGLHDVGDQLLALVGGDAVARRGLHGRQVGGVEHPQRAPHREVLDHRAVVVQRGVEIGDAEVRAARPQRQVRRGRVGGVQADERVRDVGDAIGRWARRGSGAAPAGPDAPRR